jgi:hypothetical protein
MCASICLTGRTSGAPKELGALGPSRDPGASRLSAVAFSTRERGVLRLAGPVATRPARPRTLPGVPRCGRSGLPGRRHPQVEAHADTFTL